MLPQNNDKKVDPRTREGRTALAKMLMRLFDLWRLSSSYQLSLLGLSEKSRTSLARYRKGAPLDDSRDLLDRVSILFSIHRSLRILFPKNRDMVYDWLSTPNRAFDGHKPVEIMREKGFLGLLMVERYLNMEREA